MAKKLQKQNRKNSTNISKKLVQKKYPKKKFNNNGIICWFKKNKILAGIFIGVTAGLIVGFILLIANSYKDRQKVKESQKSKLHLSLDGYVINNEVLNLLIYFLPLDDIQIKDFHISIPFLFKNSSDIPIENFEFTIWQKKIPFVHGNPLKQIKNSIYSYNKTLNYPDRFVSNDEIGWDNNNNTLIRTKFYDRDDNLMECISYRKTIAYNPKSDFKINEYIKIDTSNFENQFMKSENLKDLMRFKTGFTYRNNSEGNIITQYELVINNIPDFDKFVEHFDETDSFGGYGMMKELVPKNYHNLKDFDIFLIFPKFLYVEDTYRSYYQLSERMDIYKIKYKHKNYSKRRSLIILDKNDNVLEERKLKDFDDKKEKEMIEFLEMIKDVKNEIIQY